MTMAILVYCPRCHTLVAPRGVDLEAARFAATDHDDEHDERDDDEQPAELQPAWQPGERLVVMPWSAA